MSTKKKRSSYLLGGVVVLIWAVVIYRAFSGAFSGEEEVSGPEPELSTGPPPSEGGPDSFSLKLDYEDPFLKEVPAGKRRVEKERTRSRSTTPDPQEKKEKSEEKEPPPWPELEFGGIVRNRSSEEEVVLMSIDGDQRLMKEGQGNGTISLERVWADSVRVAMKDEKRVIAKKQGRNGTH